MTPNGVISLFFSFLSFFLSFFFCNRAAKRSGLVSMRQSHSVRSCGPFGSARFFSVGIR